MNDLLATVEIWAAVFLLITLLSYILRKANLKLPSIINSLIMTVIMVPVMVYGIIPFISSVNATPKQEAMVMTDSEEKTRYQRGLENLSKIDGEVGEKVIESLKDIAPDMATYIIEYPFGDIYNRQGLDLRSRQIATIAGLTALGNAQPQLKVHIQAGLNVGLSEQEIIEIMIHMSVYAGFPAALNAIFAAKEVFDKN